MHWSLAGCTSTTAYAHRLPFSMTHGRHLRPCTCAGCLGITLSFHRQLSHRSFTTPKWLEYALAYCGVLAVQGDPIEWVSSHRYHHLHTDTPLDPHSPYEGFWWSHMGWLLNNGVRGWALLPAGLDKMETSGCGNCYPEGLLSW